jgi:hypothetical protein
MSTLAAGGTTLRPLPIFKLSAGSTQGVNLTVPFLAYSTLVNHGAVTGGPFQVGAAVTSSSGGSGVILASTGAAIQVNQVAGTFLATDTLTQTTGTNAGATAVQAGASALVGPFTVGDTLVSSSGGVGTILVVNPNSVVITNPTGTPFLSGTFNNGDTLTQTTGAAAGATALQNAASTVLPGLIASQQVNVITLDVTGFMNGRIRGNFHQDQDAELHVRFGNDVNNMDLDFTVPQDLQQPNFQYAFDIIIIQPIVQVEFTCGVTDSSFLRAFVSVLPI